MRRLHENQKAAGKDNGEIERFQMSLTEPLPGRERISALAEQVEADSFAAAFAMGGFG